MTVAKVANLCDVMRSIRNCNPSASARQDRFKFLSETMWTCFRLAVVFLQEDAVLFFFSTEREFAAGATKLYVNRGRLKRDWQNKRDFAHIFAPYQFIYEGHAQTLPWCLSDYQVRVSLSLLGSLCRYHGLNVLQGLIFHVQSSTRMCYSFTRRPLEWKATWDIFLVTSTCPFDIFCNPHSCQLFPGQALLFENTLGRGYEVLCSRCLVFLGSLFFAAGKNNPAWQKRRKWNLLDREKRKREYRKRNYSLEHKLRR